MSTSECVTLTDAEIWIAEYLVRERRKSTLDAVESASESGIVLPITVDRMRSSRNPIEVERDGMEAELAFCRYQNIYPDIESTCRSTTHQIDCVTSSGVRVDVKWCARTTDHLMAMPHKIGCDEIDAFVLVQGKRPTFRIVGWTPFSTLIDVSNLRNFGHGPAYAMRQEDLSSMDTF